MQFCCRSLKDKVDDSEYLKYAHGILSEYLEQDLADKLREHLKIPGEEKEEAGEKRKQQQQQQEKPACKRARNQVCCALFLNPPCFRRGGGSHPILKS